MTWIYKNKEFTSDQIEDNEGFVYLITDLSNDMKYVGKKIFWNTIKRPPLKGKKRKRIIIKESDWKDYYSSSDKINELVEECGRERFKREILHLCKSKGELSYMELHEQMKRQVLFRDDYYNGIINVRISTVHLKGWKPDNISLD